MKHSGTASPQQKADPPSENRVVVFSRSSIPCAGSFGSEPVELRHENGSMGTTTASGVFCWLSNDPIGIVGGLNQYAFCGNNPVNFVDPLGLWTVTIGVQGHVSVIGALSVGTGIAFGYSQEVGWSIGWLTSGGSGIGLPGASATVFVQVTDASSVGQLKGPGVQLGLSGGLVPIIGLAYVAGFDQSQDFVTVLYSPPAYQGFQVGVGLGGPLPLDINAFAQYTVGPVWQQKGSTTCP